MRWRLGQLTSTRRRAAGEPAARRQGAAEPATPPRQAAGDWGRLPPLRLTIEPRPALVGSPLLSLPEVSGTRSLLVRQPSRSEPAADGLEPAPPPGRMAGVVVPMAASPVRPHRADRPSRPGPLAGPAPAELPVPARRQLLARTAAAGARPALTQAAGEFVGEPRPDETPYASSAWLRMVQAYRRLPDQGEVTGAVTSTRSESIPPPNDASTTWSSSVPFPPPRSARPATDPSAERPRRASLAESRRLGLGRPLPSAAQSETLASPAADGDLAQLWHSPAESVPASRPAAMSGSEPAGQAGELASGQFPAAEFAADQAGAAPAAPGQAGAAQASLAAVSPVEVSAAQFRGMGPAGLWIGPPVKAGTGPPSGSGPAMPAGQRPMDGPASAREPLARRPAGSSPAAGQDPAAAQAPSPPPSADPIDAATSPDTGLAQHTGPAGLSASSGSPGSAETPPVINVEMPLAISAGSASVSAGPVPVVAPIYRGTRPRPSVTPGSPEREPAPEPLVHRRSATPQAVRETPPAPSTPSAPPGEPAAPLALPPPLPPPAEVAAAPPWPPPAEVAGPQSRSAPDLFPFPGRSDREFAADEPGAAAAATADTPAAGLFPPYDLADVMRRMHGIDVSDVPVSRGSPADSQARALGARAFTRAGEVVLPPDAGPFERPQTRALLAHELTHAAQQRALGPSLPPSDSAAGAELEAEAVGTELRLLGLGAQPRDTTRGGALVSQPLLHASAPRTASWSRPAAGAGPLQRQTEEPSDQLPPGNAFDPFALLPRQASGLGQRPEPDDVPRVPGASAEANPPDGLWSARDRLLDLAEQRLLDLDDSVAVGELADGIYRQVRARLQRELLIDRERSGLLSDFR